ncbi:hypothetical protein OESDEN_24023, partial [Oesophagostomum dentatum]
LRRFIARRGLPRTIISDNASTFKAGNELIQFCFESSHVNEINNFLVNEGITWKFITPLSPWKGGFYERLVGSVKSCLRKTVRKRFVSDDEFSTVVTECEAIVNSRPLTYVSSDVTDANPLRPVDFLHPHANVVPWNLEPDYDPEYRLISSKEQAKNLLDETKKSLAKFWTMWSQMYLTTLQQLHSKMIRKRSSCNEPKIGLVVFIAGETRNRVQWDLGIIIKLHTGEDNIIRSASLRRANGVISKRSVNMLIPLELTVSEEFAATEEIGSSIEQPSEHSK